MQQIIVIYFSIFFEIYWPINTKDSQRKKCLALTRGSKKKNNNKNKNRKEREKEKTTEKCSPWRRIEEYLVNDDATVTKIEERNWTIWRKSN